MLSEDNKEKILYYNFKCKKCGKIIIMEKEVYKAMMHDKLNINGTQILCIEYEILNELFRV